MNKNTTAVILIVLSIGIYFTFTRYKMEEIASVRKVNDEYQQAIDKSLELVKIRDSIFENYNSISVTDRERLNKLIPDNVDNVRLIIDVKDDIAARHGLALKNIKTASPEPSKDPASKFGVVTLSFDVNSTYENFISFLKDLESSLRIMDISKLVLTSGDNGQFNFAVEIKTYWLKQ